MLKQKPSAFLFGLIKSKIICICVLKEDGKIKHFPLQYDDKLINYL